MKTISKILVVLMLLIARNVLAQDELSGGWCVSDLLHDKMMREDTAYRSRYLLMENQVQTNSPNQGMQQRILPQVGPVYTIPVVIHIINLGEPVGQGTNISDDQIGNALWGLILHFINYGGTGVDTQIQFCLATRDPNGCPTTGINRVYGGGVPNYSSAGIEWNGSCGANEEAIKDLSRWPVSEYYNIWVVNSICNTDPNFVVAGYAYYPWGGDYDGTVIIASQMWGSSPVLTHETGHYLNLFHTFEGDNNGTTCPQNITCGSQGDHVCDTPPHRRNDCSNPNPCTGSNGDDSHLNYMSYCHTQGIQLNRFTSGQKARMRATLETTTNPRFPLRSSIGCMGNCNAANGGSGTWEWIGRSDGNWFNRCNWDRCTIPDLSSDVVIPGNVPHDPIIQNGTAECHLLNVDHLNGAHLTVDTAPGNGYLNMLHIP